MKEKIIILGNNWHGKWSLNLQTEMKDSGYNSEHINVWYNKKFKSTAIESIRKKVFFYRLNKYLFKKFNNEDISHCLVITPYTIPNSLWKHIKRRKIKLIGWWGDDPMKKGNLAGSMSYFDSIYLVDQSWINKTKYFNPNVFYLPHGVPAGKFFPKNISNKTYDLVFVGSAFDGNMEGQFRAKILEILIEKGYQPAIFGDSDWKKFKNLKDFYRGPITSSEKLNDLYNNSKIILNLHHSQLESGTNQRTFETAAAGSFQIADYKKSVAEFFGDSVATFSSPAELIEQTRYFLSNQDERNKKAEQALQVVKEHTYSKRIKEIFED